MKNIFMHLRCNTYGLALSWVLVTAVMMAYGWFGYVKGGGTYFYDLPMHGLMVATLCGFGVLLPGAAVNLICSIIPSWRNSQPKTKISVMSALIGFSTLLMIAGTGTLIMLSREPFPLDEFAGAWVVGLFWFALLTLLNALYERPRG